MYFIAKSDIYYMTSAFFNLNKYCVLEYIYSTGVLPTNTTKLKKIANSYTGIPTIINDDASLSRTGNVSKYTIQKLADGTYALLDSTTGYYYPSYDSNILVNDLTITPTLNVMYDTVRIHILSGYNFQDMNGFALVLSLLSDTNTQINLCDFTYMKSDNTLLYFNPRPLKMSDLVYDKYIEIKIPSQYYILNEQISNPTSTTTLNYYITGGKKIQNQNTLYCAFTEIDSTTLNNGILYINPGNDYKFPFDSYDKFSLLTANINEAEDGDYFQYYGMYDSEIIENFIYALNSVAGNKFYIIHDLRILEQQGASFVQTGAFSTIQQKDYGSPQIFRPVLQFADSSVSFSIEYTVRLYNQTNGRSIFKQSTMTSFNVGKYGKKSLSLYVDNVTNPLKVYNKMENAPSFSINDHTVNIVKTNVVTRYINQNNIIVKTGGDITPSASALTVTMHPFSNILGFHVLQTNTSGAQVICPLDSISTYQLAFIKNDGTKLYIPEYTIPEYQHTNGDIAFMVTDVNIQEIEHYTNKNFYIVSTGQDGIDTVIFQGTYSISA